MASATSSASTRGRMAATASDAQGDAIGRIRTPSFIASSTRCGCGASDENSRSRRGRTFAWSEGPGDLVRHLRDGDRAGDCWLIGGGLTIREFERLGVIDEYEVFVMPTLLGDGIPLFPTPFPCGALQLSGVMAWENGAVRLQYGRTDEGGHDPPMEEEQ